MDKRSYILSFFPIHLAKSSSVLKDNLTYCATFPPPACATRTSVTLSHHTQSDNPVPGSSKQTPEPHHPGLSLISAVYCFCDLG